MARHSLMFSDEAQARMTASGAKLPLTGMSVLAVPAQPVYATQALNLSLGGSNCKVFPPKLPPSRLLNSRRSCRLLVLRPGFADVAEQYTMGNSRRVLNG